MRIAGQIVVAAVVAVSIGGALGQDRAQRSFDLPVLTVCEALNDRNQNDGKTLVVVGKLVSTMEGSWLVEDCGQQIVISGHKWNNAISLTYILGAVRPPPKLPKKFRWDASVLQARLQAKLKQVQSSTTLEVLPQYHYTDSWFAVFGRFEIEVGGEGMPHGFGHLDGALAQLIADRAGSHELK